MASAGGHDVTLCRASTCAGYFIDSDTRGLRREGKHASQTRRAASRPLRRCRRKEPAAVRHRVGGDGGQVVDTTTSGLPSISRAAKHASGVSAPPVKGNLTAFLASSTRLPSPVCRPAARAERRPPRAGIRRRGRRGMARGDSGRRSTNGARTLDHSLDCTLADHSEKHQGDAPKPPNPHRSSGAERTGPPAQMSTVTSS